eukprot:scaffold2414_cov181-Pinguiococcus_pyrenoidosus.AAC.1
MSRAWRSVERRTTAVAKARRSITLATAMPHWESSGAPSSTMSRAWRSVERRTTAVAKARRLEALATAMLIWESPGAPSKTHDRRGEGQTLGNIGNCYAEMGEPRRAIEYFQESLGLADDEWAALTDRQRATFLQGQMRTVKSLERAYLSVDEADNALLVVDSWRARSLLVSLSQPRGADGKDEQLLSSSTRTTASRARCMSMPFAMPRVPAEASRFLKMTWDGLTSISAGGLEGSGASKLVIVADPAAGMACIPFAALLDEEDRYLIQRFAISAVPSLGALLHLAQRSDHRAIPLGTSCVVGNPDFRGWRFETPLVNKNRLDRAMLTLGDSNELKCVITAPCNDEEEYEIAVLAWHEPLEQDSIVRVQRDGKWLRARLLSQPNKKGACRLQIEDGGEERGVSLPDACLPHYAVGSAVAILDEESLVSRTSVEGGAVISSDMDDEGDYEVKMTVAGKETKQRMSGKKIVLRMHVPATEVEYRPDVANVLVLADGSDRYSAGEVGCHAECGVSAPCDASGKYEVTLRRWDDLLVKGDVVRVQHEARWFHGRLLSAITSGQGPYTVHVEELGQDRQMPLDECMPFFRMGDAVALRAGVEVAGARKGAIRGELDNDGTYEVEMTDSERHRFPAKDLVRRMR